MKIVRIIARLNVGGPARHVAWLTAGLQGGVWESVLVAGTVAPGEDDMSYFVAGQGVVPVILAEMSREISPKDAVTVWKLFRLFCRLRPDIVHTHTAKAGTVGRVAGMLYRWLTPAALLGRPRRCRFVHTYHGHIFHSYYGRWKTRLFLAIERFLARAATDRIIVISPQQYREIHGEFGVGRAEQFAVVPLGLDVDSFADWELRRHIVRGELRAGETEVLVGIVGRLTEIKNHALFLRAAARCKETLAATGSVRRVRFLIIGDGHLRTALEVEAVALGLEKDVEFLGMRDDPENFYAALDVVALTSNNEGTPLTLIEAMANGRACVATSVGGVVDLVGGVDESLLRRPFRDGWHMGERGVLVRAGDAEGFSRALVRLIEDEPLRRELGARGRVFVERHYSKDRLLADIESLYREISAEHCAVGSSNNGERRKEIGASSSQHGI